MSNPSISVIMAVYNDGPYLKQSIESILTQSFSDFEFLIVDDASTDDSPRIIEEYRGKDERIRSFANNSNIGLTKSLNFLVKNSRGRFLARMDGDDISLSNRFELQVDLLERDYADVVYSGSVMMDNKANIICSSWRPGLSKVLEWMPYQSFIPHSSIMMKKESLIRVGGYNEGYKKAQDWILWNDMIKAGIRFSYLNEPLILYRINPSNRRLFRGKSMKYKYARLCIYNKQKVRALRFFRGLKFNELFELFIMLIIPHGILITRILKKRKSNREELLRTIQEY